jgi:phenylacetate-coenzyme A ligase PaaK-like adenylate-forming protein
MIVETGQIAPATGKYAIDRLRHVLAFQARLANEEEKLYWPRERLHALRDQRLRALLRTAKERSPWHARRLRHIDPEQVRGDDLSSLPPMTKDDLRENWDEIVTDRRLTLELVNRHLHEVASTGPAYLLDQYHAVASSGSSGQRTVFVFDFRSWLEARLVMARHEMGIARWLGLEGRVYDRLAVVAAPNAVHESGALFQTFGIDSTSFRTIPSTLPIEEIVDGLNDYQPAAIQTYPSVLRSLTNAARAGRLRIRPRFIMCGGEPLTWGIRQPAEAVLGVPIVDVYATTEGFWMAVSFPGDGAPLHLTEDMAVFEPVDTRDQPVPPGVEGGKLLLTNVVNHLLPLIRYEITDRVRILDEASRGPWTGRRIAPVKGRVEQVFTYDGGVTVNPEVFDVALDAVTSVQASQVLQTRRGAVIRVRAAADSGLRQLRAELESSLKRFGLPDPEVTVERVEELDQLSGTGKFNRFVRLPRSESPTHA